MALTNQERKARSLERRRLEKRARGAPTRRRYLDTSEEAQRARRKLWKRKYRRLAGARPWEEITAEAQAKRQARDAWKRWMRRAPKRWLKEYRSARPRK